MSTVKESLEANMDFIREQLPENLKAHAESCLDNCDVTHDDEELIKQQIMHDLPDDLKAEIDVDSVLPVADPVQSLKDQKAEVLKALPEEFKADFEKNAGNELVGE